MVVKTNKTEYFNDILEEVKLFLPNEEIVIASEDCNLNENVLNVQLLNDNGRIVSSSSYLDKVHTEETECFYSSSLVIKRIEKRTLKVSVFRLMKSIYNASTPWGSLTGIRPTKLYRELLEREEDPDTNFKETYDVSAKKTLLAKRIYDAQKSFLNVSSNDVDVYVHIPFCTSKCLYCSFPSAVMKESSIELNDYLDILNKDIIFGSHLIKDKGYKVRCAYIGGGTPTILSALQLDKLLSDISNAYGEHIFEEFTVEAGRPETITKEKLKVLIDYGISRISINPQTMNDNTLTRIGRLHTVQDIINTYNQVIELGIPIVNMDLIAGLPGENVDSFEHTLRCISKLNPNNLTIHTLAIKNASRLKESIDQYDMSNVSDVEKMVELGQSFAEEMGYSPYYMYRQKYMSGNLENIGYAKPGTICKYNIDMMEETTSIMSHGAGSMTKRIFFNENRVERIPSPKDFLTYSNKIELLNKDKSELF